MGVYVDGWDSEKKAAHLVADTEQELHLFAHLAGLQYRWYQNKDRSATHPHYDITTIRQYEKIVKMGATITDKKRVLKICKGMKQGGAIEWLESQPNQVTDQMQLEGAKT